MTGIETVERLTDIIIRQAEIIQKLHNCLQQLNAVTSIDSDIERLYKDTDNILSEP